LLIELLEHERFDRLQLLLEYQMPVGAERADAVLLGGTPSEGRGFVLELKQWSAATGQPGSPEVEVPGFGPRQHPSAQAINYEGKLRFFHPIAASFELRTAVWLHNMGRVELQGMASGRRSQAESSVRMYGRDDGEALREEIARHLLPAELPPSTHRRFDRAEYEQTRQLFDVLSEHSRDIAEHAAEVLAETGMGLTEEQELIVEEVLRCSREGQRKAFVIQGGPGSGKTLVAVHLLLRQTEEQRSCLLALRNNRLQAILRRCFNNAYPGVAGLMVYFETRQGRGIGNPGFRAEPDLLICDEAQRMRSASMPVALSRADVAAVFLDETQRLNPPEEGTASAFANAARAVGYDVEHRNLSAAVRCRGGRPYHNWVEDLLESHARMEQRGGSQTNWRSQYRFDVCGSIEEMVGELRCLRDTRAGMRVALAASFTESPGSTRGGGFAPDNLRVGHPLTSGFDLYRDSGLSIWWLMRPQEYVSFWMQGKSNELDRAASIYGAQGFEGDYVGLIWGRDFVIRDGEWTLGDPTCCYDTIDGMVSRGRPRRWTDGALQLLKNRYRIFLTRGILGTLVFCEDPETRDCLQSHAVRAAEAS